jgi:hypothetical protein
MPSPGSAAASGFGASFSAFATAGGFSAGGAEPQPAAGPATA